MSQHPLNPPGMRTVFLVNAHFGGRDVPTWHDDITTAMATIADVVGHHSGVCSIGPYPVPSDWTDAQVEARMRELFDIAQSATPLTGSGRWTPPPPPAPTPSTDPTETTS